MGIRYSNKQNIATRSVGAHFFWELELADVGFNGKGDASAPHFGTFFWKGGLGVVCPTTVMIHPFVVVEFALELRCIMICYNITLFRGPKVALHSI